MPDVAGSGKDVEEFHGKNRFYRNLQADGAEFNWVKRNSQEEMIYLKG